MRRFFTLALVACCLTVFGQQQPLTPEIKSEQIGRAVHMTGRGGAAVTEFDSRKTGTIGTPYIYSEFLKGTLITADSQTYSSGILFNIDGVNGDLLVKSTKTNDVIAMFQNDVTEVSITDTLGVVRTFRPMTLVESRTPVITEVVYEGTFVKLYQYWGKELLPADFVERGVYSTGRLNDEYKAKNTYYANVSTKKDGYIELDVHAKRIADSLPSKKGQIEKYLADNKIKGKLKHAELVALFKHLEEKAAAVQETK